MFLITGGAGYIGSHVALELLAEGKNVIILDNLSSSNLHNYNNLKKSNYGGSHLQFLKGDIRDEATLNELFQDYEIDTVLHFAGLKSVYESVSDPFNYYDNNVLGTMTLLRVMHKFKCKNIIFSSTASVYATKNRGLTELDEIAPKSPYAQSKLDIENFLRNLFNSDKSWRIGILRYFNPVGAHTSGLVRENAEYPSNLMPLICKVASGAEQCLKIFGNDYDTVDGTGVRDFIHVVDLAKGHLRLMDEMIGKDSYFEIFNLGRGQGHSVLEVVRKFSEVNSIPVPYKFFPRRDGDVAMAFANASKACSILRWRATLGLQDMCSDAWKAQIKHITQVRSFDE